MERNGRSFACANLFCFFFLWDSVGNGGWWSLTSRVRVSTNVSFSIPVLFRGCDASCLHVAHHRRIPPFYYSIILYYQRYPRLYISLQVACQEFISSENDYLVCIQNSGFCQLCPRLHRVFRLRMCMPARAWGHARSSPECEP